MTKADACKTIRSVGEGLIALADLIADELEETAPAKAEAVPATAEEPAKHNIKLEEVRAVLAEISRKGKTAQMKALLSKFGANKLSDVDPKDYEGLLEAAKEVKDA